MIVHQDIWFSRYQGRQLEHTMSFTIRDFGVDDGIYYGHNDIPPDTNEQTFYFNLGYNSMSSLTVYIDPFAPAGSIIMTDCLFYVYGADINIGEYIYVPIEDMHIVSKAIPSSIVPDSSSKLYVKSITVSDWTTLYGLGEVEYEPPETPSSDTSSVYVTFETDNLGTTVSKTITLSGDLSLSEVLGESQSSIYSPNLKYTVKRITVRTLPINIKDQLIHIHSDRVIDLVNGTGGFDLYIPLKNDPGVTGGYPHSYNGYPDDYTEDGSVANRSAIHHSPDFVSIEDSEEWNFQYMPIVVRIVPQDEWIDHASTWGVPSPQNHNYSYPQSPTDTNYFHIIIILTVDVSNVYQTVCGVEMERGVQ